MNRKTLVVLILLAMLLGMVGCGERAAEVKVAETKVSETEAAGPILTTCIGAMQTE